LVSPIQCFYFVIFILIMQQIDGNIIGPRILGDNVGIGSFWILVSITVASAMFGFMGMLLGVPVFATIYMIVSEIITVKLKNKGKPIETKAYHAIEKTQDLNVKTQKEEPILVENQEELAEK
ncbi:MAG: AI-2E family transporter, partial [Eubacteriales bacterium]